MMNTLFQTPKSVLGSALTLLAAVALSACVTEPYNDEYVDPADITFRGYAEDPGATIEIQGRSKQTGAWVTITAATVTSSTTPANYGGETLYPWSSPNVDTAYPGQCFWGAAPSCAIPQGAIGEFRVVEAGGSRLVTFDQGGVGCVQNKVAGGATWFGAAAECYSSETPVLTLRTFS